ncbi:MAG: Dabb family protein [Bacteroidota bacterium]
MIKHIVFFKLKNNFTREEKNIKLMELKNRLDALKDKIPQVILFETGVNISQSANAFDLSLVSEFENLEKLEEYRKHPDHESVLDFINEIKEDVAVVDYEF